MSSDTPAPATVLAGSGDSGGGETAASGAPPAASDPGGAAIPDAGIGTAPPELPPPAESPGTQPTVPPPPETPPPAPEQFRFVRLVADSDVTAGPLTSVAEFDVLGADGQPLDHSGWIASADSAEPTFVGGAPAAMAIDGQPATMWHTAWFQVVPPPHPHFLQVDLGQPQTLRGFRYLARQDGAPEGRIAAYRFFVSADGVDWGEARVTGTLANTDQPQDVSIR
jgi:F5/8 type C domain